LRGIRRIHSFVEIEETAMRCEDLQRNLVNYANGGIRPDEREAIEAHVRSCPACGAVLAQMDPVAAVLVQSQVPPIPLGFTERAITRARYPITRPRVTWSPVRWWRAASSPMRGAAAAALVLGFLGGWMMGREAVRTPGGGAAVAVSPPDPLEGYNPEFLGDAPEGSLANSYLALVSSRDGEGR
jgi:anti-sigma factor RsiW